MVSTVTTNTQQSRIPLLVIDALGAMAVAACVFGVGWFLTVQGDRTTVDQKQLGGAIAFAQRNLRAVHAASKEQSALFTQHETELATAGHLPEEAPIEAYFQALSKLASSHQLRVVRQRPLASQEYPGLLEQRYAYEVAGTTADLVRFLKAIEETDFWADVSYLTIVGATPSRSGHRTTRQANDCAATLTLSMFSALPSTSSANSG